METFLSECIQSIINQSYKNLEIILVDDGSTDNCPNICDEYAKKDKRITVIHKTNGGLSDARNVGIDISSGEYITFIDSDDYIHPRFVEYLYRIIVKSKSDIATCHSINIDENNNLIDSLHYKYHNVLYHDNQECMKGFLTEDNIGTVAWGKLYKSSLFKKVRYTIGKYHEDVFTTYKVVAKCERIACGKEALYCYRHRNSSISTQSFTEKHLDAIQGKIEQRDFLKRNYPDLVSIGNAEILYAVNICVLRLINAKLYDKKYIISFQKYYRKYETDFLKGNSSKSAKLFSILAFFNLNLAMHIYSILRGE